MLKRFAILIAYMLPFIGMGDVLRWTVDENATVDGEPSVYALLSLVPDDDLHNPAARVKISGGGLTSPIYLDNWIQDSETDQYYLDEGGGYYGILVGDSGSGYYGVQSQQSHVSTELAMEALFSIELGRMDWDDDTYMSGMFQVLAESDKFTYEQVRSHMYPTFDLNPPVTDWNPTYYHTVSPEPSSLLLLLIGASLLILKRQWNILNSTL